MIFKYKDLQKSYRVELDIDNIEAHMFSIIRTMNRQPDGSLYYNESIDLSLIELIGEDDKEQECIDRISGAQPYILDPTSNLYIGQQLDRVLFFENGTGHKEKYISYVPGVSSNVLPYRLLSTDSIIIKFIQYEATYLASGNIIDIKNTADDSIIYQFDVGTTPTTSSFQDNVDVVINGPIDIGVYINNNRLDNPAFVLGTKRIWEIV